MCGLLWETYIHGVRSMVHSLKDCQQQKERGAGEGAQLCPEVNVWRTQEWWFYDNLSQHKNLRKKEIKVPKKVQHALSGWNDCVKLLQLYHRNTQLREQIMFGCSSHWSQTNSSWSWRSCTHWCTYNYPKASFIFHSALKHHHHQCSFYWFSYIQPLWAQWRHPQGLVGGARLS